MKTKYLGLMASVGLVCVPGLAAADGTAPAASIPSLSDVLVKSGITVAGYVDASYEATFNSTSGATTAEVPLHAFDTNSNSFMFNQAALTLSYLPTSGAGALVNVIAGEDAKVINGSYNGGAGSGSDFALTQGYVQYAVGNLTVIGGRFVTLAGAEVIDDTKNADVSRSLLFTNMEPLVHTGVRASYKFSDLLTGNLGVNNTAFAFPFIGAPTTGQDTNKPKTLEVGAAITPSTALAFNVVDYYGVDNTTATGQTKDNVLDLVGTYTINSALSVGANVDVDNASSRTGSGDAQGLALYFSDQFTDQWKGSVRGEFMRVRTEAGGGATSESHVSEVTFTADYTPVKNFDVLGEFREDYGSTGTAAGSVGLFPDTSNLTTGTQKSQSEVLLKAIFKFGTPVPTS